MKRRRFFQVSVLGSLGLGAALLVGEHTLGRSLPDTITQGQPQPLLVLSASESVTLRAVALRILDGASPSPLTDGGAAICQFVDRYLTNLPTGVQSDVRALLHLVELYPLLQLQMARFSHLRAEEQDALLSGWQDSRIGLLRQGFQALKSLVCLAHYQDARSFATIGYSGPLV